MSYEKIPERIIGTKAYLPQPMRDFLDTIVHEDAAKSVSGAVQWCIDACMRIEKKYGIDACYIAYNDIRLPENDPNPLSSPQPFIDREDVPDTNVGDMPQRVEPEDGKQEVPVMGHQLAAEADIAALDFGRLAASPDGEGPDGSELTDAYEAGQSWMWRKLQAELSSLKESIAAREKAHAIAVIHFAKALDGYCFRDETASTIYDLFLANEANKNINHKAE